MNLQEGRIHEVLLARQALPGRKRRACGAPGVRPFTILNVLIDAKYVFKAMRKKPELMKKYSGSWGDSPFMEEFQEVWRGYDQLCRFSED